MPDLSGYTVELRNTPIHSFLVVTAPNGQQTQYGFDTQNMLGTVLSGGVGTGHIQILQGNQIEQSVSSSTPLQLSTGQYQALMDYINTSIANPPLYNFFGGAECTVWAVHGLNIAFAPAGVNAPPSMNPETWEQGLVDSIVFSPGSAAAMNTVEALARYEPQTLQNMLAYAATWNNGPVNTAVNPDGSISYSILPPGPEDAPLGLTLDTSGILRESVFHQGVKTTSTAYDATGQRTTVDSFYASGGTTSTLYSSDPSTSWYSKTDIRVHGRLVGTTVVNRDGTSDVTSIDAAGKKVAAHLDEHGQVASQVADPGIDFNNFARAVADTLATQLIARYLTANNVPATIVAQAFADAAIGSALDAEAGHPVDFSGTFASSAFNIAGGIAGSEVGSTIAKALGLPAEGGNLIGGTVGNMLTQAIVKDVFHISGPDVLTPSNLKNSIAGAGGAYVGQLLADALVGPTEAGQIIGSLATAAAVFAIEDGLIFASVIAAEPYLAPLIIFAAAFGSDFVGNVIGSLFGAHQSVGPNASAVGQWNPTTHAFEFKVDYKDNGGDPAQADAMIAALNGVMTNLVPTFGGTVTGPVPNMSLAWIQGHYYYQLGDHYPTTYPYDQFSDPMSTVEAAAVKWLASIRFTGANPYMVYAAQHTDTKTLAGLISDLNAAKDYSAYLADPVAFDAGIAASGDPAKLLLWQAELVRVHQLGLDSLTPAQIADLNAYGTTTPVSFGMLGAYNEANYPGWQFEFGTRNADGTALTLPSHIVGTTTNAAKMGGYDLITSDNNAFSNLKLFEFAKDGTALSVAPLTYNGTPLTNWVSADYYLGSAQGLLGGTGKDLLFVSQSGILSICELDPATPGVVAQIKEISSLQNALKVTYNQGPSSIIGTATNVLGTGGPEIFVFGGHNNITVYEFDAQGNLSNGGAGVTIVTSPGHALTVPDGTLIVGSGPSPTGMHDHAFFMRYPDGSINIAEYNNGYLEIGQNVSYTMLKNADGSNFILEPGATIQVAGKNLTGNGKADLIIQHVDQHFTVAEIDTAGHILSQVPLLNADSSAFGLAFNETIAGAGVNFGGQGGHDLFIREPNGQVSVREFDANGHTTFGQTLDVNFTLPAGRAVIGAGANFSGNGGRDLFIREPNGQVTVWEFDSSGQGIYGKTLDANFVLGTNVAVVGAGTNFSGNGGHNVFIREPGGQVTVWEFDNNGHGIYGQTLDPTFTITAPETIAGAGQNIFNAGGRDLFVREANGQIVIKEFNAAAQMTVDPALVNANNTPFVIDPGSLIVGTAAGFKIANSPDFLVQKATGELLVDEFNAASGVVTSSTPLVTAAGAAMPFSKGVTILGTAHNLLGHSGYDLVVQKSDGSRAIIEINPTDGHLISSADLSGSVLFAANTTLGLDGSNMPATVIGNGNTLNVASNITGAVAGSGNSLSLGTADTVTLYGGNNQVQGAGYDLVTVQTGDGNAVTVGDNSGVALLHSNGDTVTAGQNAMIGVTDGHNETLNLGTNANTWLTNASATVNGSWGYVYAYDGVNVTVNGSGNVIGALDGDGVTIAGNGQWGTSDTVYLSHGALNLQHDANASLNGSFNTVAADANDLVTVNGDHNALSFGTNGLAWVQSGYGTVLNGAGMGILVADNVSGTSIRGDYNLIHAGAGDKLDVSGNWDAVYSSGSIIYVNGDASNTYIEGNNNVIHIRATSTGQINGVGNTVVVDSVVGVHDGDTLATYNGLSDLLDFSSIPFDSSMTVTPVLNAAHTAGDVVLASHGATVATVHLGSIQNLDSFSVRADGAGGTLVVDPPSEPHNTASISEPTSGSLLAHDDAFHFRADAFLDATKVLAGTPVAQVMVTEDGRFDFSAFANDTAHVSGPALDEFHAAAAPVTAELAQLDAALHDGGLPYDAHDPLRPAELPHLHPLATQHHDLI
jgi:hypothetical protein